MSADDVKEDFLEADQKIPGQNFVCLSFVSPEKFLKEKELFFTSKFLEYLFTNDEFVANELRTKLLNKEIPTDYESVQKIFEDWKYSRREELETTFFEKNDYKTSIRGLKVRGVYDTHKEATVRAQILRRKDPSFNIFIGQVGYWLPWDPECDAVPEQEYQESMLNDLVKKYKENLDSKDDFYDQVKAERVEKAKKELAERKEALRAQTEMKVTDDDTSEDIKNIEKLRDIVEESSKAFYDNLKKQSESSQESLPEPPTSGEELETNTDKSCKQVELTVSKEEPTVSEEEIQNFSVPDMKNLEEEDPWMKRKSD